MRILLRLPAVYLGIAIGLVAAVVEIFLFAELGWISLKRDPGGSYLLDDIVCLSCYVVSVAWGGWLGWRVTRRGSPAGP